MSQETAGTILARLWARWANTHTVHALLVALVLMVGAGARLFYLEGESPWHDEALTVAHLDAPSLGEFMRRACEADPVPRFSPLYYLGEYAWASLCGASIPAMRTFSIVFSMASIVLLYLIGRRLYSPGAGLAAALALSLSFVNVYYAQEIRFYAMTGFLVLLSMWAVLRALDTGHKRDWTVHFAANAALLMTHAVAGVFLLPQALYVLAIHRHELRRVAVWFAGNTLVALFFAAWMALHGDDVGAASTHFADMPPSWREFANALLVFTGGRYNNLNPALLMPAGVSFDFFIGIIAAVLTASLIIKTWRDGGPANTQTRDSRAALLLLFWLMAPPVALYAASQLWKPFFFYRYMLPSSFALCLLLGAAITRLRDSRLRLGLAAALFVALAYQQLGLPRPLRPNFAWAAAVIESRAMPDAIVYPFKILNELPFRCNSRLQDARIRGYGGFPELCHDSAMTARAGIEVWAVFTLWARIDDFEEHMRAAGLQVQRFVYPGPAPITVCQVVPAPRDGPLDRSDRSGRSDRSELFLETPQSTLAMASQSASMLPSVIPATLIRPEPTM